MEYMVQNYNRNLAAIQKQSVQLYETLSGISENIKFDLISGDNIVEMNIRDIDNHAMIYPEKPSESISKILDEFDEYSEYPFLYMFGIANGTIATSLLKNPKLQRLCIVEPEIEILFMALHIWDLSNDISSNRLIIFLADHFDFATGINLFLGTEKLYAKAFTLLYPATYYETYHTETISRITTIFLNIFDFVVTYAGNSIQDALLGIEHHVANLQRMIEGPIYQKNFPKAKGIERTGTVVMASSGPSLEKQLPLLREIQNNVTIICGESTLKILELNGITPDICVSMERIIEVVKSFENVQDDYKKKVIFVRASLQHNAVFDVLKGTQDVLVMRPFAYNRIFDLDEYGYLCSGTSVANMAHELAFSMGFKTCIIIGQDLAYGADGKSHAKGHNFGEFQNKLESDDEITAYGGEGKVQTNFIWKLFLRGLIQTVAAAKNEMLTINSTEGGARIDGTLEMPFAQSVKDYIDMSKSKTKLRMVYPSQEEIQINLEKAKKAIILILDEGKKLQEKIENAFLEIAEPCKKLENLSEQEQLEVFSDTEIMELLDAIEKIRNEFNDNQYFKDFFYELCQSNVVHFELDLATIKVKKIHNPIENKQKALAWIYNHVPYLFTLAGTIHHICETVKKSDNLNCISEKQVL